jgi:hypothetical protein
MPNARLEQQIKHVAEQRQRMAQQITNTESRSTAQHQRQWRPPCWNTATPAGWRGHRWLKPNSTRTA